MSRGAIYALVLLLLVAILIGFGAGLLVGSKRVQSQESRVQSLAYGMGVLPDWRPGLKHGPQAAPG